MLAKTVKVNIKVRRRKKVASSSIAISKQSLLFSLLFCTVQNTIHVSASGIPLSSASYKIKGVSVYNEIEETSQPAITS